MNKIKTGHVPNLLLIVGSVIAVIYLGWWLYFPHMGQPILYSLLFFGEIYHVFLALGLFYTVWNRKEKNKFVAKSEKFPHIDVFITVAGEPIDIVARTAIAAKNIQYPNFKVFILNDGYVANKDNWKNIEEMAQTLEISCITRKIGGGAKAGNINNGLRNTSGELIAIFDADMVPHEDFLQKLTPYFEDPQVGFVQSPQYYKNYEKNEITAGAWEQQGFFFGPIMRGKNTVNSAFICGTNVVIRRKALDEVGGIDEDNIAEDFLTSLLIHKKKWRSIYHPEVLSEGLSPEDLLSYWKQQHRWARGSLEILFKHNPIFTRGLTFAQRFQYLHSSLYYFNGAVVLIDIMMPLLFLYFGWQPVSSSTTSFALFFIPYMFVSLYVIFKSSGESITFRSMSFSQSSWVLQLKAFWSILIGKKVAFSVTPKNKQEGNYLYIVYPHLLYIGLTFGGVLLNIDNIAENTSAVFTNIAWALFNIIMFLPFIIAAFNWKNAFKLPFSYRLPNLLMQR